MSQFVTARDGTVHTFPDDAPDDQIRAKLDAYYAARAAQPVNPPGPPGSTPGGMQPVEGAPDMKLVPSTPDANYYQQMMLVGGMQGNRAMESAGSTLYKTEPSTLAREEAGKGAGKSAVELAQRQAAGNRVMPGIGALRKMILEASDDDWKQAAGPYNSTPAPASNTVPMSRESWRAPDMTPTQARASYGYSYDNPAYQRQWRVQNDLVHLKGALTEQYITAMGKAAIANSDAKMKVFEDLMDRMRFAPHRKAAMGILDTAEDASHNTFSLNPKLSRAAGSEVNPIHIRSPEDVKLFRVGTHFVLPDGTIGVKERE